MQTFLEELWLQHFGYGLEYWLCYFSRWYFAFASLVLLDQDYTKLEYKAIGEVQPRDFKIINYY